MSRRLKLVTIITSLFILAMVPVIGMALKLGVVHAAPNGAPTGSWTGLTMPSSIAGATLYKLQVDPTNGAIAYALDASGSGNLWKTTNGGTTWIQITGLAADNLTTTNVFIAFATDKMNHLKVYGVSSTGTMYQSLDGGTTWATMTGNTPGTLTVSKVLIDPNNDNQLYVEDLTNHFTQSIVVSGLNATWTNITGTSAITGLSDVVLDPAWTWTSGSLTNSTLILVTAAYTNNGGVGTTGTGTFVVDAYQGSTAATLSALVTSGRFLGAQTQTITITAADAGTATALLSYGTSDTLYVLANATDTGTTHSDKNVVYYAATTASSVAIMATSGTSLVDTTAGAAPTLLFAADPNTAGDVFWYDSLSTTPAYLFGFTTSANATSGSTNYRLTSSNTTAPTTIAAGTISSATNLYYEFTHVSYNSANPTSLTSGVSSAVFAPSFSNVVTVNGFAAGTNFASAPFGYAYNTGASTGFAYLYSGATASTAVWTPTLVNSGQAITQIVDDPMNQSTAYALSNNQLFTTVNGGTAWTQVTTSGAPATLTLLAIDPTNDKHLVLSSNLAVYESVNSGANWYLDTFTAAPANNISQVAIAPANGAVAYVVDTTDHTLFMTSGAGKGSSSVANFAQVSSSADNIAVDQTDKTGNTVFAENAAPSMLSSTNGGSNWTTLGSTGFIVASHPIVEYSYGSTQVVLGQSGSGPNYTTNAGSNWTTDYSGITGGVLSPFVTDTGYNTLLGINSSVIYYQAIPQAPPPTATPTNTATPTSTATATPVPSTALQSVGVYDATHGAFFLDYSNAVGSAGNSFNYGPTSSTFTALDGYWSSGQTTKSTGLYDPASGTFFLKNTNAAGNADETFVFGSGSSTYKGIAGKWASSDTTTGVGLYNPTTGMFFLKNALASGTADISFQFGPTNSTFLPIVGDWTNQGYDTVGLYDPATGTFYLRNTNAAGSADTTFMFGAGNGGYTPVVGRWQANSATTVGLYNASTGTFYLRNTNNAGNADVTFGFGATSLAPMAGNWH